MLEDVINELKILKIIDNESIIKLYEIITDEDSNKVYLSKFNRFK